MTRYRGKHRPGSPRVLLVDEGLIVLRRPLDDDEIDQLRREWVAAHDAGHGILWLPNGADPQAYP